MHNLNHVIDKLSTAYFSPERTNNLVGLIEPVECIFMDLNRLHSQTILNRLFDVLSSIFY